VVTEKRIGFYVHLPWCVRRCPYCDFNAYAQSKKGEQHEGYVAALVADIASSPRLAHWQVGSIFFGGGTPSLFSARELEPILTAIDNKYGLAADCEITLEANPGTIEHGVFADYVAIGINRLSLGVQSFNKHHLKVLGRIHDDQQAVQAYRQARAAGFKSINVDVMYGLPEQSIKEACDDLAAAIALESDHISWYQLTIEPNTYFAARRPVLPVHDALGSMMDAGLLLLEQSGFGRYEVSAYAKEGHQCRHNLNYWMFGDYLGVGAGAHSKWVDGGSIWRSQRLRLPHAYMKASDVVARTYEVKGLERAYEFMLNYLRLNRRLDAAYFVHSTGLDWDSIAKPLKQAQDLSLLTFDSKAMTLTSKGWLFVDEIVSCFV
jgi:putative oxygen-independent coproporphyrinogen III oxidase